MFNLKAAVAAIAVAIAGAAFAQTTSTPPAGATATPGIDKRQANQEKRIEQGVKSGELTKKEAGRLEKRESKLQADKEKAQADGKVTKQERKQLQHEASRDSKAIYRQKHDAQKQKESAALHDRKPVAAGCLFVRYLLTRCCYDERSAAKHDRIDPLYARGS